MDKRLIVAVSDIHLGTDHPCAWYQRSLHEPYLAHLLQWVIDRADQVRELVLLGDIVDTWTYPADEAPPTFAEIAACQPAILGPAGLLAQALDALNGAVTYVPGNHDMDVTQADLDLVRSPQGRSPRLVEAVPYVAAPGVALAHGHHFTLFNTPTTDLPWSPLPLGYFVSRTVATRWKRDLAAGTTVAELPDQGAPNGVDLGSLGRVVSGARAGSAAATVVDFVSGATGIELDLAITMPDGSTVTLAEARDAHASCWTDWSDSHGGGIVGQASAARAALADLDGSYLGWFAQQLGLAHGCELVVMGHTHVPIDGLDDGMLEYVNTGFDCPSGPDLSRDADPQQVTFAVIELTDDEPRGTVWAVERDESQDLVCHPIEAPATSVVNSRGTDFSCYIEVDNRLGAHPLELVDHGAPNGVYVNPPPTRIEAGGEGRFWLQDLLGAAGSAGWATYRRVGERSELDDAEPIELRYTCPTVGTNSCSGTDEFATMVGGTGEGAGVWREDRVAYWGHPFFVAFEVR